MNGSQYVVGVSVSESIPTTRVSLTTRDGYGGYRGHGRGWSSGYYYYNYRPSYYSYGSYYRYGSPYYYNNYYGYSYGGYSYYGSRYYYYPYYWN